MTSNMTPDTTFIVQEVPENSNTSTDSVVPKDPLHLEKENVLSKIIFNSKQENIVMVPWRTLSSEKRLEILDKYFETEFNNEDGTSGKTIDKNTIDMIRELVIKGKLKLKKEITYDRVNERIIQLHALVSTAHTDHYVYKPELLIKKEKSKKIARSVLFRKK